MACTTLSIACHATKPLKAANKPPANHLRPLLGRMMVSSSASNASSAGTSMFMGTNFSCALNCC
ncbi:Uncharacterised protein [Vibrio cholerae]|nr:Uncharacterised protein [Vibrio cholerae]